MEWRSSGRELKKISAAEYQNRHGNSKGQSGKVAVHSAGGQQTKTKGKGKK
jgi:hypothetical protein